MRPDYPDAKAKQGHDKERKSQVSVPDAHKCKSPPQHVSKANSAARKEGNPPWLRILGL